uniref:Ig-like domain-containing protein n=1 Tax=Clastoptera arizonana TaxID=38151 RepID=A0A1B6DR62_9HEMI
MDTLYIVLLSLLYYDVGAVQITSLRVPPAVHNGTGSAAILDCQYTLRPEEASPDSGLVVKWFFNNGPTPVYQWIPSQKPQELGVLRGRLNLDYKASHHASTMHRALYITNPTTELSGEYKCSVSTFNDEDFMIKRMIVFAPEKSFEVVQTTIFNTVNITCRARGVYPEPKIALFKHSNGEEREQLQGVSVEISTRSGQYDISATSLLDGDHLQSPTVFQCELRIPHTTYAKKKNLVYYAGSLSSYSNSLSDCASTLSQSLPVIILLTLLNFCGYRF